MVIPFVAHRTLRAESDINDEQPWGPSGAQNIDRAFPQLRPTAADEQFGQRTPLPILG
jgi:hypothetical protein